MSSRSNAPVAAAAIRAALDLRQLPWVRPLVSVYAQEYDAVAPLFAGNPADPAAWRRTIARVASAARHRAGMADVLARQLDDRQAPHAAREQASLLRDDRAVAIVTGQQAGLFGGPLYTALKAVTAVQLARRVSREHGVPAVPIFWVDSEDHDWDEIRTAAVLDRDGNVTSIALSDVAGAGTQPVASLALDQHVSASLDLIGQTLPPSEFTSDVISALTACYRPGTTVSTAFAMLMDRLLGDQGLVVFDAADPAAKPFVADLFAEELAAPGRTSDLVRAAGARMRALGHQPQVDPSADGVNVFYLDASGRKPVRRRDGQYVVGDGPPRSVADLSAEAAAHPERFSPNVILRPLVQDRLFPTVCYVAGPAELAYQAQLGDAYRAVRAEPPLLYSRVSASLLDSAAAKFFDRCGLGYEAFHVQDDSVLNRLLERQLPPDIEHTLSEAEREMTARIETLRGLVPQVDPTLSGAVDTTLGKVRDTLQHLQAKIVQASKRKDDTLRRQFSRTRTLLFPDGQPQERVLNVSFFANRYGWKFAERLLEILPDDTSRHYLVVL
jgi:bacillithiol biosynthesis cysteine-adding enzyme BshC